MSNSISRMRMTRSLRRLRARRMDELQSYNRIFTLNISAQNINHSYNTFGSPTQSYRNRRNRTKHFEQNPGSRRLVGLAPDSPLGNALRATRFEIHAARNLFRRFRPVQRQKGLLFERQNVPQRWRSRSCSDRFFGTIAPPSEESDSLNRNYTLCDKVVECARLICRR